MKPEDDLHNLLLSHDIQADEFGAIWALGRTVNDFAAVLNADPDSAAPMTLRETAAEFEDALEEKYALLHVGSLNSWTLALEVVGFTWRHEENAMRLSEDGRKAVSLGWDIGGNHRFIYAEDGSVLVNSYPALVQVPSLLAPYADGLFLDEEMHVNQHLEDTMLSLAGRICGAQITAAWLDETHTRYVIPG